MEELTREKIFAYAAEKLRAEFEELRNIAHAGLKGQEGEEIIRTFLNKHLPNRFRAGAGFIINRRDQISKQTDVVIYDALNCPLYRASDEASIFPNDNVAGVIEVKSVLDKQKLEDAARKIGIIKSLVKSKPPDFPFPVIFETLGVVFAFDSPLNLDKIAAHYKDTVSETGLPKHIDYIFILDKGLLCLFTKPRGVDVWAPTVFYAVGNVAEGTHVCVASTESGRATLDAFLRMLLVHLQFFGGIIDHPGFKWSSEEIQARLFYLSSITFENDPEKRKRKLEQYREEVTREFKDKKL